MGFWFEIVVVALLLSMSINLQRIYLFMKYKVVTCFFCFEQFEVSLEVGTSFVGNISEIYDCEVCCNPNKLDYEVYDVEIKINNVGDGNE